MDAPARDEQERGAMAVRKHVLEHVDAEEIGGEDLERRGESGEPTRRCEKKTPVRHAGQRRRFHPAHATRVRHRRKRRRGPQSFKSCPP